ncbi:MAG TPA: DUF2225 domain-containing protein, partial [Candidatus Hydrogenedentes bacterium]|nr:DUF2225 domain-containing protein [Candidatus Hydrogenedentota bacterium]
MPSQQSPFVHKALACPACSEKTEHRFFRRRVYVVEESEPDQHALRYRWASDQVQRVNPLYYALFFCPHCFYADVSEDFAKPPETESLTATLHAFKKAGRDDVRLQLVGRHIDYEDIDFESALRLHFLAVLIHSLVDKSQQDAYKLGRLYLRIAWLYREHMQGLPAGLEDATGADSPPENIPPACDSGSAPLLLAAVDAAQEALKQFEPHRRTLERLAGQRADELSRASHGNPYLSYLALLISASEQLGQDLHALRELAFRDVSGLLHGEGENAASSPAQDETPRQEEARSRRRAHFLPSAVFMESLAALWDGVPRNEQEALVLALEAFRRALTHDVRLENPQRRLKVSTLVAELATITEAVGTRYDALIAQHGDSGATAVAVPDQGQPRALAAELPA